MKKRSSRNSSPCSSGLISSLASKQRLSQNMKLSSADIVDLLNNPPPKYGDYYKDKDRGPAQEFPPVFFSRKFLPERTLPKVKNGGGEMARPCTCFEAKTFWIYANFWILPLLNTYQFISKIGKIMGGYLHPPMMES
jgi:hypothetical protein